MKKITLLSLFLMFLVGYAKAQNQFDVYQYLKEVVHPSGTGLQERSLFPRLLDDSLSIRYLQNSGNGFQIINEEQTRFYQNQLEQTVQSHRILTAYFTGSPVHYFIDEVYAYDQEGRPLSKIAVHTDEAGFFTAATKNELIYTGSGKKNYVESGQHKLSENGNWVDVSRNTFEGDATFDAGLYEMWDMASASFQPSSRFLKTYDANENLLVQTNESFSNSAWYTSSITEREYDTQNNLVKLTYSYGSETEPVHLYQKEEYTYDAQGRNTYTDVYIWDAVTAEWTYFTHQEHLYDMDNHLTETKIYVPSANGQYILGSRKLYTQGPGIYSDVPEEILTQNWNGVNGTYADVARDRYVYSDLPDGRVLLNLDFATKQTPGQGDWQSFILADIFLKKSQLSAVSTPDTPQSCTVPNPYSAGFHVQCDQLKTEASYMVWVYDMAGKAVYAKHFKGGEGWSIDQQLNAGTYVAVITQNDRRVASYQLVTGR